LAAEFFFTEFTYVIFECQSLNENV
jgi:hypothetical protein